MRLVVLAVSVAMAMVPRPAAAQPSERPESARGNSPGLADGAGPTRPRSDMYDAPDSAAVVRTILAGRATGLSPSIRVGDATRHDTGITARRAGNRGPVPLAPSTHPGQPVAPRESWWSPVVSALVPGTGQALLGQDRAIAYFAVEGYGWIRYASDLREARRQRNDYRGLAARVARAYFSEVKPVGQFEYYERMETYVESGVFDASLADGTQPETDPESYNGFIWLRARTTFWEDPAVPPPAGSEPFSSAIRYYEERAIRPEFRWSWRNAQLEQDIFRRTIGRSNDAFRRSIQDLGVIIANHALSTVDAYVTVRIRRARNDPTNVGVEASIPWSPRRP
jgi:hypothetical protein